MLTGAGQYAGGCAAEEAAREAAMLRNNGSVFQRYAAQATLETGLKNVQAIIKMASKSKWYKSIPVERLQEMATHGLLEITSKYGRRP